MTTNIIQKAIVINAHGEMLMVRRSKTDVRRPLEWDLPGGIREPKEELLDSVRREIVEETGLEVTELEPVYTKTEIRTWKDGDKELTQNAVFIFYTAKALGDKVKLSYEHDTFQWLPMKKAIKEYEYYLHRELIGYVLEYDLV